MSAKAPGPTLIHVPALFSIVEPGVYRCASPTALQVRPLIVRPSSPLPSLSVPSVPPPRLGQPAHGSKVPFLATLHLRTIISLTPEHPIKPFLTFTRASGIQFVSPAFPFPLSPPSAGTGWG